MNSILARFRIRAFLAVVAFALGAILGFHGLGIYPLWEDEANTALYARNLLRFGELRAWDGTNFIGTSGVIEVNEDLMNTYLPPQQYYVAAASMSIFGQSAFAARAPFLCFGLLTLLLIAWCSRRYFETGVPSFVPMTLLALSPAYLLFMRNCRYYSLAVFWSVLLFAIWIAAACESRSGSDQPDRSDRRWPLMTGLLGVIAVIGLFSSQYLNAVAALAVLPVLFVDRRFRSRRQLSLLGLLYLAGLCCMIWTLSSGTPAKTLLERHGTITGWIANAIGLLWWHIRDLGYFEFFAWPLVLALLLPWLHARLIPYRPLASRALALVAMMIAFLFAISTLSPQATATTTVADMRYGFPVIAIAALIGSAAVTILWHTNKAVALSVAIALIGTNALHVGSHRHQVRHDFYGAFPVRSTLVDYVRGNFQPFESTETKIQAMLATLPEGTTVWLSPFGLSTSSMFALPHLRYCGQLARKHPVRPDLAARLPDYVFSNTVFPEALVILGKGVDPRENGAFDLKLADDFGKERLAQFMASNEYEGDTPILTYGYNETRPEVPGHLFWRPRKGPRGGAIALLLRKQPVAARPQ